MAVLSTGLLRNVSDMLGAAIAMRQHSGYYKQYRLTVFVKLSFLKIFASELAQWPRARNEATRTFGRVLQSCAVNQHYVQP